jgi:hypothetical protein
MGRSRDMTTVMRLGPEASQRNDPGDLLRTLAHARSFGKAPESAGAPVSPSVFKTVDGA